MIGYLDILERPSGIASFDRHDSFAQLSVNILEKDTSGAVGGGYCSKGRSIYDAMLQWRHEVSSIEAEFKNDANTSYAK